ncbi:MAG: WXG100 family type VII secretion target [Anaerolineales bacterium]|nr:WXG100 family type VII secretion target [Anaerolineales bacterium]
MAEKIQVQYEELDQLATRVHAEGDRVEVLFRRIRVKTEQLASSWLGEGSVVFQREMGEEILPGLRRLAAALEVAGTVMAEIQRIFREAEEQAVAQFPGGEGGAVGEGAPAASWQGNEYLVRDPHNLFTDEYMHTLIGSRFQGAGPELRRAMYDLMKNPSGEELNRTLERIAELRGRPISEIQAEYDKYILLRAQRDASGATPIPDLNTTTHPFFMGSNTQLRYGDVVGEAFGVDPVFGAMLNPTGGLVGPGNFAIDCDDTAVGYHGVVHDAGGYLYTYHGHAGPGYDYLGLEGRDTSSPFSGQREGIAYWRRTVGDDPISYRSEEFMRDFVGTIDVGSWVFEQARSIF